MRIEPADSQPLQLLQLTATLGPAGSVLRALRLGDDDRAALSCLRRRNAPELPQSLARAVVRRQVDFIAGRYCAREALREMAPHFAQLPIEIGPDREPLWPEGVVGSIAHARGYAMAMVAPSNATVGLGVDIEHWMQESAPAELEARLAVPGEINALADAMGWPASRALTLTFSAKESLYKCLFTEVRQFFDFKDAAISHDAKDAQGFVATLLRPLGKFPVATVFTGRFECLDEVIVTALHRAA